MRVLLLLFIGVLLINSVSAQEGIRFEEGNWAGVLAKAKAEKKLVFLDVYTSWCVPCKMMVKNIFPLKEVGTKFNGNFVNYKIDAEKGEGIEVAKKYKVNGYPTYLFVNGDGVLVYRSTGSMPAEKFLTEATTALGEFNDPKPFAVWEDEYDEKKNDAEYLYNYLQKRKKLKLNSADVLDQYFKVLGKDRILETDILGDLGMFTTLNVDGPFYTWLLQSKEVVRNKIFDRFRQKFRMDEYLVFVAKNDVERAVTLNDEQLLHKIVAVLRSIPPDEWPLEWREYEVKMKYYTQTNDYNQLQPVLKVYSASLLGFDRKVIRNRDSLLLDQYDKDIATGKIKANPETLEINRKSKGQTNATSVAYKIRDAAKSVLKVSDSKKELALALQWIQEAEQLSGNFSVTEVKAGLLYKLGRKDQALVMQQKAIDDFTRMLKEMKLTNEKILGRLSSQFQKMKEGNPEWD